MKTIAGAGDPKVSPKNQTYLFFTFIYYILNIQCRNGIAIHIYTCNTSMVNCAFYSKGSINF